MKKVYDKPVMYMEEFALNDAIADCGDEAIELDYHCLRGGIPDEYGVFNTDQAGCDAVPTYFEGVTYAKASSKAVTLTDCKGAYAYCVRTDHKDIATGNNVAWEQNGTTLTHKKNGNADTHDMKWHCMVAPAYGEIKEMRMS